MTVDSIYSYLTSTNLKHKKITDQHLMDFGKWTAAQDTPVVLLKTEPNEDCSLRGC